MDSDTILIIGGLAIGGYIIYKTLGEGITKTGNAIGDTAQAAGGLITYNITGLENFEKDIVSILQKGFQSASTNNYYYSMNTTNSDNPIGATNSEGGTIGVKSGTLGLTDLTPKQTGKTYSQTWLKVTPTNTQNVKGQTAIQAIQTAQNPYIQNVNIPIGNSNNFNPKPVSLPPSILSIVTGKY